MTSLDEPSRRGWAGAHQGLSRLTKAYQGLPRAVHPRPQTPKIQSYKIAFHERALELVPGANFICVLQHFSCPTRLKGSWGQLWPKTSPKQPKTKMIIFPRGLTATQESIGLPPPIGPPRSGTSVDKIMRSGSSDRSFWGREQHFDITLCYAIVLPGRKSVFRAGFRPDSSRESIKIGSE